MTHHFLLRLTFSVGQQRLPPNFQILFLKVTSTIFPTLLHLPFQVQTERQNLYATVWKSLYRI